MRPSQFKAWRKSMGYTQQGAASALGLCKSSIELYERGTRRDNGEPVFIPKKVELACDELAWRKETAAQLVEMGIQAKPDQPWMPLQPWLQTEVVS